MTHLIPRDFLSFPRQTSQSFLDAVDDMMSFGHLDAANTLAISEDDNNIYIEAAIPGIDPDDVEITYDRGMLWIRGQARTEEKDNNRKFYRRVASEFSHRIAVPGDIDQDAKWEAQYKNGMIMINFPKAESSQPKRIPIKKIKSNGDIKSKFASKK